MTFFKELIIMMILRGKQSFIKDIILKKFEDFF